MLRSKITIFIFFLALPVPASMPGSYPTPKSASVTKTAKTVPKPEEDSEPKKKGRVESTVHRGEVDSASDLAARLTGGYSGSNLDINRSFYFNQRNL